ncbi:protein tramtrack, beta isoform-like isoform X1 [Sitophilus oryzae]|uniref:Protein tramtrack, beta isoform-like isoform X1 n=1 Tax=Sitophilus oryzae TaxID=7048 RepID=A0A6J2XL54_SITOR|nr:protein tramtrack, beta isoform-like isoform X1 [Sitophilus oryzae]
MASEQFSLCWDNFHKNMSSGMNSLLENEDLVDVTLAVEGKYLKAHKMVLSVCSPYFKELFKVNPCQHPIVFLKDVSYVAISDLLQFMYQGEVQVSQDNLTTFIKTAEALQIKGLTGDGNGSADVETEPVQEKPSIRHSEDYKPVPRPKKQAPAPIVTTTASKRPRLSVSSNDSQSAPAPVTKTEPISLPSTDSQPVQFKMEPYDQNQSVTIPDDTGDDNFGDDTLDDTAVDDTEDYSMMEGEEPQAGTSTDGAGEGQDTKRPKTTAERVREYRARKKLLKQKSPAKTAAQRNREYRARKKALRNAANIGDNDIPSMSSSGLQVTDTAHPSTSRSDGNILYNILKPVRPRKSCAQRCREYRERKRARQDAENIVAQRPVASPIANVSSNVTDIQVDSLQVLQPEALEVECDVDYLLK